MNFHKTIGFLAALLLTLGLGVPDSFAQNESIAVTINPTSITEGEGAQTVAVDVALTPVPAAGVTVMVTLTVNSADVQGSPITRTVAVHADNNGNGSADPAADPQPDHVLMINPMDDDADGEDERVTILAEAAGHSSGTAGLTITDDELTLQVVLTPDTFREGTTVSTGVVVTVVNSVGTATAPDADRCGDCVCEYCSRFNSGVHRY